jgi:hypothetical protein
MIAGPRAAAPACASSCRRPRRRTSASHAAMPPPPAIALATERSREILMPRGPLSAIGSLAGRKRDCSVVIEQCGNVGGGGSQLVQHVRR